MATHFSILAWRIPWTEEPGGLQSTGLQKLDPTENDLACMHAEVKVRYQREDESRKIFYCWSLAASRKVRNMLNLLVYLVMVYGKSLQSLLRYSGIYPSLSKLLL